MSAVDTEAKGKLDFKVKIDQTAACQRHIVVTVPRAEIDRYFREAYSEIAPRADLPGFRQGKIPRKLLESRFKKTVADQVKSSLVMDSLQQITEGGDISAIAEPDMDYGAVDLPDSGDFTFEFNIEVRPEFSSPNWQGLKLTKTEYTLTEDDVEKQLVRTLERFVPGEPWDGEASKGDRLLLEAEFSKDGRRISSFDEVLVTLRDELSLADCIIENFGELMSGSKEGDKVATKVKILETSLNESLRGTEVDAVFKVIEIRRVNVEALGPKVLEQIGFDDTDELREFVRSELKRQSQYHQTQLLREQITKQLTSGADWELPSRLVRRQAERELQRRVLELRRNGFEDDQIKTVVNSMRRNIEEMTREALREHFVLEKIAEDLSIEPTEQQYEEEIKFIAEQIDATVRQVRTRLDRSGQMDAIRNQILERDVIDKIVGAAEVNTVQGESILKKEPKEFAVEFLVAPVTQSLPEAKYDERPEDGADDKSPVKPT
ncbi:MAG: trigger factor [Planctomycetota bacterium]